MSNTVYLTVKEESILRRLYGLSPEEEITEIDEGAQILYYARKYNIAYRVSGNKELYYGNPLRDMFMTDREYDISPQWLRETDTYTNQFKVFSPTELSAILNALSVLQHYDKHCPEGTQMLKALLSGTGAFDEDDKERFIKHLIGRQVIK